MNDLPTPPPPAPPFEPRPFDPGATRKPSGCQKPLLFGCLGLAVLLGIAAIVFVVNAQKILGFAMNQLRTQVVRVLPLETSDAERERLDAGFDQAIEKIRAKQIDPVALQALQRQLVAAAQAGGERRMTHEQLLDLLDALDAFNGAAPAPPALPTQPPSASPPPPTTAPAPSGA